MYTFEESLIHSVAYFGGDALAGNSWTSKYALKDGETILEKTPDDMHRRLAREFARIESKYPNPLGEDEIYSYLQGFKQIVAQGSPMAAIGNPYQVMVVGNCFVAGTKVHTRRGVKNIEDIEIGDEVVTHKGRYRRVLQTHKNRLEGRQLYAVKAYRTPEVTVTGNHQLMSISREQLKWGAEPRFNPVEYLRVGDYIQIPNCQESFSPEPFDLRSIFGSSFSYGSKQYVVHQEDDRFKLVTVGTNGKFRSHSHLIPNVITPDSDFAYFLGLWYGDGCVFGINSNPNRKANNRDRKSKVPSSVRGITFTFGSRESEIITFVCEYLTRLGITFDLNEHDAVDGTTQIAVHSPALGYAFERLFGRGFEGKALHSSIFGWGPDMVRSLLQGVVDSDGTITRDGDVRVTLANKPLIQQLYHLARSQGIFVGYSETSNTARLDFGRTSDFRGNSNKSYADSRITEDLGANTLHTITINGQIFTEIRSKRPVSDTPEYVYTFGVEEDHSYSVEGLISLNCFVVAPPVDSYGGILLSDQHLTQLMKRRAGVGVDLENIRPKGVPTLNAARTTDGIGVFMERFSNTCREVAQNGRRGALMITVPVDHPDVEIFVDIKRDRTKVTGANISTRLTDEFMRAVVEDSPFMLRWPRQDPKVTREIPARDLWDKIVRAAHDNAEPGLLFWDNILVNSLPDLYADRDWRFRTTSTNPCGEIPLGVDSCRLLVVNLTCGVDNPYQPNASWNSERFRKVCRVAQRLMDDVVDIELEQIDKVLAKIDSDPEPEEIKRVEREMWENYRATAELGRRTGLGVTALGDAMAMLGIKYGSDASIEMTERIYRELALAAHRESAEMAKERGAFPLYDFKTEESAKVPYLERIWEADPEIKEMHRKYGRRNIALTTTAPTGTVSIMTQTSNGIEPVFMTHYERRKKINPDATQARVDFVDEVGDTWQHFTVYHRGVEEWMKATGKTDVMESPYYGATANDIDWINRVRLQAAAQRWISHSISSTLNLPKDVSVETVSEIYLEAWKSGCKGITIYRDGCRDGVLISGSEKKEDRVFGESHAPKRPETLPCEVHRSVIQGEDWIFFVGLLEDRPYEIFGGRSHKVELPKKLTSGFIVKRSFKGGGKYDFVFGDPEDPSKIKDIVSTFDNPNQGAMTRLVSLSLRHGTPVQFVVEQLQRDKGADLYSFAKVASRVLKKYIPNGSTSSDKMCPSCGAEGALVYQEGCLTCRECGYTKCG